MMKKFSYAFISDGVGGGYMDYILHHGQDVKVLRRIPDVEAETGEVEYAYEIQADDGWVGTAFESELT